jgi:hypothetical protein
MIRHLLCPAVLLVAIAGCGPERQTAAAAAERGEIYRVLLESVRHHAPGAQLKHRYVQVETVPSSETNRDDYLLREVPEVTPELLAAFRAAESRSVDVRALVGRGDVEWITRDSLAQVMRAATTPQLPRSTDFTATRLSPIGLSADGKMALVYVQEWCGGLCGAEYWAVLRRQPEGGWVLLRTLVSVVS